MADEREARQLLPGECLPRLGVVAFLRLQVVDCAVVEPSAGDGGGEGGVFQVVARMARSSEGTAGGGARTKPTRRPVAMLFDSPET